jgi:hypothetical protein
MKTMSTFLGTIGDFLWEAIDRTYHGPRRRSPSGFVNLDCPMCPSRGESADKRQRCGVRHDGSGIGVNCFNCGFKAGWRPGWGLSQAMKEILRALGLPEVEVAALVAKAGMLRGCTVAPGPTAVVSPPSGFPAASLPEGARAIDDWAEEGCTNPDFLDVAAYLLSRGEEAARRAVCYWAPAGVTGMSRRLIVPFWHRGAIVGYTARAVDPHIQPRYYGMTPQDYLFNGDLLKRRERKYVLLVEGVFDAIAVGGVGLLGSSVSQRQAAWLRASGQTVIVLPDRDAAGEKLIDAALTHGWHVAFPSVERWWEDDIKDAADAVARYEPAWVVLSAIATATADPVKIAVKRRLFRPRP